MFELYQLRYFLAVVETGNFTKAAERTYVTQPTLSAGIKKLEGHLGTRLFHRTNRRVFLTEAGTRFVERAKTILFECNRAALELKEVEAPTVLRLGVLRTIPSDLLSRLIGDFRREEPVAVIELFEGTEQEILNRFDAGGIDLAISILRPGGKYGRNRQLFEERYALALAVDHPLAERAMVKAEEIANDAVIVRTRCEVLSETSRYFTDHNVRPRLVYRTAQDERALAMVAAGLGFTVMPEHYRHSGVSRLALDGLDLKRTVGLIYGPDYPNPDLGRIVTRFESFTISQNWAT